MPNVRLESLSFQCEKNIGSRVETDATHCIHAFFLLGRFLVGSLFVTLNSADARFRFFLVLITHSVS